MITTKLLRFAFANATLSIFLLLLMVETRAQENKDWELDQWPVQLEMDFALSALPVHLRDSATVYLLNPKKGYYIARQGANGFSCFVSRTEWEWADFSSDHAAAISYDAEGSRTILRVFLDVASMRASGKLTALQVRDSITRGIKNGTYKAPATTGVSYMLAPMMRTYPGKKEVVSMHLPHYMFYAPYLDNKDIGGFPSSQHPVIFSPAEMILGRKQGPFNYIIIPAGEKETERIIAENKDLLKRLAAYKPYLKVNQVETHH